MTCQIHVVNRSFCVGNKNKSYFPKCSNFSGKAFTNLLSGWLSFMISKLNTKCPLASKPQVAQADNFRFYEGRTHSAVKLLKAMVHELYLDRIIGFSLLWSVYTHEVSQIFNPIGNVFNIHFMRATFKHKLFISKR